MEIKLHYNHNHAIQAADAMCFRPVSEETKKMFTDLFDEDISPCSAYRRVLDYLDTGAESFADRYNVPDYKWSTIFMQSISKTSLVVLVELMFS